MASIALFAAGSSIGGALGGAAPIAFGLTGAQIGGAVGGLIGSVIDQQFLFAPKQPDIKGPRIDDYQIQTASEGSPLRYDLGPENKHTGNLMWIGMHNGKPFEERVREEKVDTKGGSGSTQTSYSYYADVAVALCEGPVTAVRRVWADSKPIYVTGTEDDRYEGIALYTGAESTPVDASMTANSLPNSHIESFEGAGSVPKYKGVCYMVIDSLHLADFGNRIPSFSALIEAQTNLTVASAIGKICERAGLTSSQYDVSRVPECLFGYSFTGPVSMVRALEPILTAYDLIVQESGGKLHFLQRGDEVARTVVATDFPATTEGGETPYPMSLSEIIDLDLPSEVNVRYIDANADYGQGNQSAQRINFATTNVETVDVPLVLSPRKAATIARRRLFRSYVERKRVVIRLPYSYIAVQEGDVLQVPFEGETYRLLVEERDRGENGILEYNCVVQDVTASQLEEDAAEGSTNSTSEQAPYTAPAVTLVLMDIPALIDSHTGTPGVYFAASLAQDVEYRGGGLYSSGNNVTSNFELSQPLAPLAITGTTSSVLGGVPTPNVWDRVNEVMVVVEGGSLVSATQTEVLNGANWAYIGGEIIGFADATLISAGVYKLNTLLRGMRHTEEYINSHAISDKFVLLSSATTGFDQTSVSRIGTIQYYRAVTNGGDIADFSSKSELMDGNTVKCFSPAHLTGERDGSNNLTLSWFRRTRSPSYDVYAPVQAPNLSGQEVYEIDVLDGSGGNVVRTISVSSTTTTTYTAAQQTSDGLTPGATVYMKMYQIDSIYGRGFASSELAV